MLGPFPKPHDGWPRQLTALATARQIGLAYGRFDHPALDQLLGAAQGRTDWRGGDRLAVAAFLRRAEHVQDPAVHLENLWLGLR